MTRCAELAVLSLGVTLELAVAVGCASTPSPSPGTAAARAGATKAAKGASAKPVMALAAPWEIPDSELGTQRYLLLHYDGPEGDGALRLVLRLERPSRFSLEGRDRLGRRWFTLLADRDEALYLDERERDYCRFHEAIEISAIPLGPLPFDVLPALLLNRLPLPPRKPFAERSGEVRFVDHQGRSWSATLIDGHPSTWTLWREGRPSVTWLDNGETSYLSSSEEGLQVRWRQKAGEPLAEAPAPLTVPDGYVPAADCS